MPLILGLFCDKTVDPYLQICYNNSIVSKKVYNMIKLVIGFVLGLVVSQVGFSGITTMLDKQVDKAKTQVEILAK